MLMVDLRDTNARITLHEILRSGRRRVSNPFAFSAFVAGFSVNDANLLMDKRWQLPASASSGFAYFKAVLHELLPTIYNVRHLESLGGQFALRLTGVGEYTVTALNRRIVTFAGLPVDNATGTPIIDVEIPADVFMALCNEQLTDLAKRTLKHLANTELGAPA